MGIIQEYEIIKTKFEIQEQARKNITREIHDNIGQVLSLVKLHLATLDSTRPEEVVQKAFTGNLLLSKAIKDLRNLTKYLDAEYISRIGFLKSLEYELGFIPLERTADPAFTVTGSRASLKKEEELLLFRAIQKVIAWFLVSSNDSQLSVQVQYQTDILSVRLYNQGQAGSEQEYDPNAPEMNLVRTKLQLIGADLQMECINDHKMTVHINLPL
jgi:two-component system NarL family sensor kinase